MSYRQGQQLIPQKPGQSHIRLLCICGKRFIADELEISCPYCGASFKIEVKVYPVTRFVEMDETEIVLNKYRDGLPVVGDRQCPNYDKCEPNIDTNYCICSHYYYQCDKSDGSCVYWCTPHCHQCDDPQYCTEKNWLVV